jgi:hypothetical protein
MAELLAFTADHVARLTGLSNRQLRYWDDTGFFAPALLDEHHAISNFHRAGADVDGITLEYPRLTPEDVPAAIDFEAWSPGIVTSRP